MTFVLNSSVASFINETTLEAKQSMVPPRLANLVTRLEPENQSFWAYMTPQHRPSFTLELIADIRRLHSYIHGLFGSAYCDSEPFKYYVFGSRIPGIYNLGGDLAHFADRIRARDVAGMRHYAHESVAAMHQHAIAFDLPVITIGLVQGDALGGGFECALAFDVIIAERSAKLGLPEILFNMFPGMGGYSLLARRIGIKETERLITSGKVYTAAELHELGVVDILAEDGDGEATARDYIDRNIRRFNAHHAIYRARRRVHPIELSELRDVVDIWVDAAMQVTDADIRMMLRLSAAQNRRLAAQGIVLTEAEG
jgi:DSF synthase